MPHRFRTTTTNLLAEDPGNLELHELAETDRSLKSLLLNFNLAVEASFKAGGMEAMAAWCTPAGVERMKGKYANWRKQQISALNLVRCDFLSFDLVEDGQRAQVFTYEKWVFVYEDGREVATSGSVDGYDIHLTADGWRVDSVTFYAPNVEPG